MKKIVEIKDGLAQALTDAHQQMVEHDCQGFDYKIGEFRGLKVRIVAEQEGLGVMDTLEIDGELNFKAFSDA
jgi:hypothetical protein